LALLCVVVVLWMGIVPAGRSFAAPPDLAAPAVKPAPAPAASGEAPVMVPVAATSQRELSPEIQENLRLLTGQNSLEARQIGAQRMLRQGPAAIGALRHTLLNQPPAILVQAIAQAVADSKDSPAELVDPLLTWLAAEQPEVRTAAVAALSAYRDNGLASKLRGVASAAQNPQTQRLAAVTILSRLADRDSIETLIELLDVQDEAVRTSALTALGQLTGVGPERFGTDVVQWRRWWQGNRNRKPLEWLAASNASLMSENRDLNAKVKFLSDLVSKAYREVYYARSEQQQPALLVEYLDNKQVPEVRLVGLSLINLRISDGKTVAPEVAEQLRRIIYDADSQVRQQAIRVLGDLRNREDAKLLLEALARESDPTIAQTIARALGRLGDPTVIPALLDRLDKGDAGLASACAAGLGELCRRGNTNAVPAAVNDQVITGLKERFGSAADKVLRQEILEAMAKMADERFRSQFLTALQGTDVDCRRTAVKAFADLNGPDDADKILAPLLGDPEWSIRAAASAALGKIGKTRQISPLLQRCDKTEPNEVVRRAAKDAAISIMLGLDSPALKKELDRLAGLPGQAPVLVDVLESARAQRSGRTTDDRVQAVLLASLAGAKESLGEKEDAAKLWVQLVMNQPSHPQAISSMARTLIEVGKPEMICGAVQNIAGGQSPALPEVLTALTQEVQANRTAAADASVRQALSEAAGRIDTGSWPVANRDALRTFVQACNGGRVQAASTAAASMPAGPQGQPTAQRPY
jgi:HEAT repeat protein